jgi:hypothetical protein
LSQAATKMSHEISASRTTCSVYTIPAVTSTALYIMNGYQS